MILENVEGLTEWNIPPAPDRIPGISAFIRLKDEAEYIIPALESVRWCDEIVIALQGVQTDGTAELVRDWSQDKDHMRVLEYPFDSVPNGPGHGKQQRGSVYERAYFYNWTLAQTTRTHALKWDGDMVALDDLGFRLRTVGAHNVRFYGAEIAKREGLILSGVRQRTPPETRLFRVTHNTYYETGPMCEVLTGISSCDTLSHPAFLHFKHAKAFASRIKAWPENWQEIDHFKAIRARDELGVAYKGEVPSVL